MMADVGAGVPQAFGSRRQRVAPGMEQSSIGARRAVRDGEFVEQMPVGIVCCFHHVFPGLHPVSYCTHELWRIVP